MWRGSRLLSWQAMLFIRATSVLRHAFMKQKSFTASSYIACSKHFILTRIEQSLSDSHFKLRHEEEKLTSLNLLSHKQPTNYPSHTHSPPPSRPQLPHPPPTPPSDTNDNTAPPSYPPPPSVSSPKAPSHPAPRPRSNPGGCSLVREPRRRGELCLRRMRGKGMGMGMGMGMGA